MIDDMLLTLVLLSGHLCTISSSLVVVQFYPSSNLVLGQFKNSSNADLGLIFSPVLVHFSFSSDPVSF